jgi:hypothetical protein
MALSVEGAINHIHLLVARQPHREPLTIARAKRRDAP